LSVEQCQQLQTLGLIKLDGAVMRDDCVLKEGQVIDYTVLDYQEDEVDTNWTLLWQNQHIAAVHKPANLPVSRTTRNVYNTLVQILRRESLWPDAHLLHRLDLETSGVVLIAHNNEQAKFYQPKLAQLMQRKKYHAIIHGEPSWQVLQHQSYLNTKKDSAIRCQMHSVDEGLGKLSETHFTVLASNNGFTLVECELLTGRKHQIRAHLSQLGHPIVGDKIYSNNGEFYLKRLDDALVQADHDTLLTEHHLLHAYEVQINDMWTTEVEPIVIRDDQYSGIWLQFAEKMGLWV
jgi:23S rRNA pseudouridine1911/1915/1917 synthase